MWLRIAAVVGFQAWLCLGALADDLAPGLRTLIAHFQAHRRVAIGYLRTQNGDLGTVEIEQLRERWTTDRGNLPAAITKAPALSAALAVTETLVADSLKAADAGDVERARKLLEDAAKPLDAWRRINGIRLFSDCIAEIGAAYERVDRYRVDRPDLASRGAGEAIVKLSAETIAALERCDREAPNSLRHEPEFRRLFDGMLASLRQMPKAVGAQNSARLHRLLIEQRSFERLLAFRFG